MTERGTGTGRAPVVAIVVAAGSGTRSGGGVAKQYRLLAGSPVLTRTLKMLLAHPRIDHVTAVIAARDRDLYSAAASAFEDHPKLMSSVLGGDTRQASVRAGLEASASLEPSLAIVHDGARPLAGPGLVDAGLDALETSSGAIPAVPVSDTLKRCGGGRITGTVDRDGLFAAQTPQAFRFGILLAAHRRALAQGRTDFTDDAALLEWCGEAVAVVAGERDNIKITEPQDFYRAERALAMTRTMVTRTGIGYDVHAFTVGDGVVLGGVRIAHTQGVLAHSDGDVVMHAATDALLGAMADGDIGAHFPPTDPRWKGASSGRFLAFAAERLRRRGGAIAHLDVTIVTEVPRIDRHRSKMRRAVAEAAGIGPERVSIKATTSEGLGFVGRREGLAAIAIATVEVGIENPM